MGSGTAASDDPNLTARPAGLRRAARVVVDSQATLSLDSQLVRSSADVPVIVAVAERVDPQRRQSLQEAGCQLIECPGADHLQRLDSLLVKLADRTMTNVLVEGGGRLLGNLFQLRQIDEVHAFIATKIAGGQGAITPIEGLGVETMDQAVELVSPETQIIGSDIYIKGYVQDSGPITDSCSPTDGLELTIERRRPSFSEIRLIPPGTSRDCLSVVLSLPCSCSTILANLP